MTALLAPALGPGATVGVGAPSWCGPALAPHRVRRGAAFLESLGYRVVLAPHIFDEHGWTAGTAEERAADLMAFVADDGVDAIWAAIGGDHACQVLPLLDWERIGARPKVWIGYSDITVLTTAVWVATGLVTFDGPTVMDGLAEFPGPHPYTVDGLRRVLEATAPGAEFRPAPQYTDEFLDWATQQDLTRPRGLQSSPGWRAWRSGAAEGVLLGGCLASLQHLRGTPFFP